MTMVQARGGQEFSLFVSEPADPRQNTTVWDGSRTHQFWLPRPGVFLQGMNVVHQSFLVGRG